MEVYILTVVVLSCMGLLANALWVLAEPQNISWPKILIHTTVNAGLAMWGLVVLRTGGA